MTSSSSKTDRWFLYILVVIYNIVPEGRTTDNLQSFEECVYKFGEKLLEKCDHQVQIEERAAQLNFGIFSLEKSVPSFLETAENRISDHIRENFNRLQGSCSSFEGLSKLGQRAPKRTPEYINGAEWSKNDGELSANYSKRHRSFISKMGTAVHLPTEVYDGSSVVKKDLLWTENILSSFSQSHSSQQEPYWQYLALKSGVFRLYPISKLDVNNVYDARLEEWYVNTATSPKTVLIALDTSGSVEGMVLELIRQNSKLLLDTLTDNDFVKVVAFSDKVRELKACPQSKNLDFVRATRRNILALKQLITTKLRPGQKADFETLFDYTFAKFWGDVNSKKYGSCSKATMILTDGGEINQELIFSKKIAKANKDVRVFTYGQGPEAYSMDNMRELACDHQGLFHEISNFEAIWEQSLRYMSVLTDPIALNYYKGYRLSEPNLQPWSKPHFLVISLTCPVIGQKSIDKATKTFVGVTGIDIPIAELGQRGGFLKAWPNVELLMINEKGFLLTTSLVDEVKELPLNKTLKVSVGDVIQFLHTEDKNEFMKNVLAGKKELTIKKVEAFENIGLYAYLQNISIYYRSSDKNHVLGNLPVVFVRSSKYGLAVDPNALFEVSILKQINSTVRQQMKTNKSRSEIEKSQKIGFAQWPYCPGRFNWIGMLPQELMFSIAETLGKVQEDPSVCDGLNKNVFDTTQYQNLIGSIFLLQPLLDSFSTPGGVLMEYFISFGGVSYVSEPEMTKTNWWKANSDPKSSIIYQRALSLTTQSSQSTEFVFANVRPLNFTYEPFVHPDALINTHCIRVNDHSEDIVNVLGLSEDPILLNKVLFHKGTYEKTEVAVPYAVFGKVLSITEFDNIIQKSGICSHTEQCYVLDEGGYIVSFFNSAGSRDFSVSGENFAEKSPCFMAHLVKLGIYKKHTYVNNYCSCVKITPEETKSAARRPLFWTMGQLVENFVTAGFWLLSTISLSFWESIFSPILWAPVLPQEYESPSMIPTPCSFAFNKYYYHSWPAENTSQPYFGSYRQCGSTPCACELQRTFKAMRVPNSNLLIISSPYMTCNLCETEENPEVWDQIRYTSMQKKEYDLCEHLLEDIAKPKSIEEQTCPDESKFGNVDYCRSFAAKHPLSLWLPIVTPIISLLSTNRLEINYNFFE